VRDLPFRGSISILVSRGRKYQGRSDKVEKLLPKSVLVSETYVLVGRDLGCYAVRVYHVRYELLGRDFGVRRRVRRY
jgi:hypothetical protein